MLDALDALELGLGAGRGPKALAKPCSPSRTSLGFKNSCAALTAALETRAVRVALGVPSARPEKISVTPKPPIWVDEDSAADISESEKGILGIQRRPVSLSDPAVIMLRMSLTLSRASCICSS